MEDLKILFWVLVVGIYIFSQIRETIKKARKNIPVPKSPVQTRQTAKQPVSRNKRVIEPAKSLYDKVPVEKELLEKEIISREAFYKSTHMPTSLINYDEKANRTTVNESVFGVDEHLTPYTLKQRYKHPLLTFLSDKNNLRNAFIAGEVLNKKQL
jgi:hypothetical protein